jgi:hypothetical protein
MSKLSLSLENLEVSSFEPASVDVQAMDEGTYDTINVFCTAPKYSCLIACPSV